MLRAAHLGVQTGAGGAEQAIPVVEVHGRAHALEELDRLGRSLLEALRNGRGVDTYASQFGDSRIVARGTHLGSRASQQPTTSFQPTRRHWSFRLLPRCPALATARPAISRLAITRAVAMAGQTILAAGCSTAMCFRMVAPSLVMTTSPLPVWICDPSASREVKPGTQQCSSLTNHLVHALGPKTGPDSI